MSSMSFQAQNSPLISFNFSMMPSLNFTTPFLTEIMKGHVNPRVESRLNFPSAVITMPFQEAAKQILLVAAAPPNTSSFGSFSWRRKIARSVLSSLDDF
jgi:hypothetical protein